MILLPAPWYALIDKIHATTQTIAADTIFIRADSCVDFLTFAAGLNGSFAYFDNIENWFLKLNGHSFGVDLVYLDSPSINQLNTKIEKITKAIGKWSKIISGFFAVLCVAAIYLSGYDQIRHLEWQFIYFIAPFILFIVAMVLLSAFRILFSYMVVWRMKRARKKAVLNLVNELIEAKNLTENEILEKLKKFPQKQ